MQAPIGTVRPISSLVVSTRQSIAQNAAAFDPELENQSAMYAECAAYYRLVYFALVESQQEETASAYREMEDNAMFVSLAVASKGRSQDMAVEVTISRIEMSMKIMKQEIDNRNENISILINKYQFSYQEALSSLSSAVMQVLNSLAVDLHRNLTQKRLLFASITGPSSGT